MNSGCICCSLTGDFRAALHEVCERYAPDRILIEPSGVGKLSDIVTAVEQASDGELTINALCTVVDAGKCKMYMRNFGEFFNNQVESAGCIILSRTAGIKEEKLAECVALLREKNPGAVIITTPWDELSGAQMESAAPVRGSKTAEATAALASLGAIFLIQKPVMVLAGGLLIGFFGAGGVLQLVVAVANEMFPKHRGVITSIVMIASSVANYAMVSLAGLLTRIGGADGPRLVLLLNMAVMLVGILLALYLNTCQKREGAQE